MTAPLQLFYDGECGLCHSWVRFALAADPDGRTRFAPLGGGTFDALVPPAERESLPDSLVVVTPDGRLLDRSAAVLRVLEEMGGAWMIVARVASLVPRRIADALYDGVARSRHRLAPRPATPCPVVPEHLRSRFDP